MAGTAERDDPEVIGRRVQRLRTERGFTQRRLAEPAYTPAYISTLEAGRVRASEPALRHVADRLGVGYEELATGRPAGFATELRLRLTGAQRTLAGGATEAAAEGFAVVLTEAEEYGLVAEQADALLGLGECALETGELETAQLRFEQVEQRLLREVLSDLSSERGALHSAAAHRLLGIIAEDARDADTAEEHYVRALSLLERAGAAGDLADLCRLLGDLYRRTGRVEAALDAYRTGLGHRTALGSTTLGPAPAQPPL